MTNLGVLKKPCLSGRHTITCVLDVAAASRSSGLPRLLIIALVPKLTSTGSCGESGTATSGCSMSYGHGRSDGNSRPLAWYASST